MPFRSIVAAPHELEKLASAFDSAWVAVTNIHTVGERSQKLARTRLAEIILELWREDPDQALSAAALERFFASGDVDEA